MASDEYNLAISNAVLLSPAGYGTWMQPAVAFNHLPKKTRIERTQQSNREFVEKERLINRREQFKHYEAPGAIIVPDVTIERNPSDRYFRDFAAEERDMRRQKYERQQSELERRRAALLAEEERRNAEVLADEGKWEERTRQLQQKGLPALANMNIQGIDIMRNEFTATKFGAVARAQDEQMQNRVAQRSQYLAQRSSGTYNPLTGEMNNYARR